MKVQLVVATGVHQGKTIPIPGNKLVIGRDPQCHLRPASPAISKTHCSVEVRDGRVYAADLGSTNGTFVNDAQIDEPVEVRNGDRLRVGPLDFSIQVVGPKSDSTPLPESLKAVTSDAAAKLAEAAGQPAPVPEVKPKAKFKASGDDADNLAAMLLAEDDGESPEVPEGSTVMELPAVDAEKIRQASQGPAKPGNKPMSKAESSAAANEILKKYMKRPK